jgi:xylan 1,4-beta-xylosidase
LPEETGQPKEVTIELKGLQGDHQAFVSRLDSAHGSLLAAYQKMGRPAYPTSAQTEKLRKAAQLPPPEKQPLTGQRIILELPAQGLSLVEIR